MKKLKMRLESCFNEKERISNELEKLPPLHPSLYSLPRSLSPKPWGLVKLVKILDNALIICPN